MPEACLKLYPCVWWFVETKFYTDNDDDGRDFPVANAALDTENFDWLTASDCGSAAGSTDTYSDLDCVEDPENVSL